MVGDNMGKYTDEASRFSSELDELSEVLNMCLKDDISSIEKSLVDIKDGDVLKDNVTVVTEEVKNKIEELDITLTGYKTKIKNKSYELDKSLEEKAKEESSESK